LIITAYNTVFNTTGTPAGFSYILAIDWFMDRLRTTLNITGDAVVTGLVAHLCPMGIAGDAVCINDVEKISESGDGSSDDMIEPVVA
jgi:Na+/H+-dicarboxylate symporter